MKRRPNIFKDLTMCKRMRFYYIHYPVAVGIFLVIVAQGA